eukprot:CAMPEP_0172479140 /NCGR_PEP_ID=MMETSP1066-20121228/3525_1 /TAXON_ID=671091 /ORGANISM="Coscinodiscus wailesii, Strain CCMP2513" /LENGTH=159 /DNA_ID=CAMNT_0013239333 /DNA_START=244 /DNA_END=723 /DNA_ORIENTATION=-
MKDLGASIAKAKGLDVDGGNIGITIGVNMNNNTVFNGRGNDDVSGHDLDNTAMLDDFDFDDDYDDGVDGVNVIDDVHDDVFDDNFDDNFDDLGFVDDLDDFNFTAVNDTFDDGFDDIDFVDDDGMDSDSDNVKNGSHVIVNTIKDARTKISAIIKRLFP